MFIASVGACDDACPLCPIVVFVDVKKEPSIRYTVMAKTRKKEKEEGKKGEIRIKNEYGGGRHIPCNPRRSRVHMRSTRGH